MSTSFTSSTILPIFILLAFHHSLLSVEGLFGWNSNSKSSSSSVEHSDNSLSFNFELSHQRTKVEQSGSDEDAQAVQQQQQDGNGWGQSSQYSEYGSNSGNGVGDSLSGGWNSVGVQTYGNDMIQAENCDDDENNNNNDQNDGGNGGQQMTNGETNYYSNSNYSSNSNSNSNSSNSNSSNSNSSNSNSNASLSEEDANQQPGQGQTNSNSESNYYYNSYSNATNGRQEQTSGSNSESNLYSSNNSYYNNSSNSNDQEDNQQHNGQQGQNSSNSKYSNANSDEDDGEQQPLTSTTESIYDASSNHNSSSSQQNYNYSYEYSSNSQNYTQNEANSQQNYQYSYSQNSSSNSQNSQNGDTNSGNGDQQQNNVFEQYIKSLFTALTQSKEQTLRRQARARLAACVHAISVLLWQGYEQLLVNNGNSCNNRDANNGSTASTCSKPELDDVALQLSQNEFGQQLNQTVDGNGPYGSSGGCVSADQVPTTEQIVAMIKQYSYTYELVIGQSSGISINESSSDGEITSAIGTIMRQTSQLQQQLQNNPKK